MKRIFALVSALVLGSLVESQAATITESNLTAVSTINPLDYLRVVQKSTTGNSRSMTASNLVNFLKTNQIAGVTTPGITNLSARTTNGTTPPIILEGLTTPTNLFRVPRGDSTNGALAGAFLVNRDGTNVGQYFDVSSYDNGMPHTRSLVQSNQSLTVGIS